MPKDNLISIDIPAEDVQVVMDAIGINEEKLKPYLVALSSEERKSLLKMGDRTIPFVAKMIEYADTEPEIVPNYMDVPELKKDLKATETTS